MMRVEPSIWKTPRGHYQVRYRDPSGRQRARTFERLNDARNFKARARLLRPRHGHLDPSAARITFAAWSEAYLEQRVSLRQRTKDRYESELRAHLLPRFGERPLFAIARSEVQDFIVGLVSRDLAPATIKGTYCLLASIMRLAEEEGLITQTPCRRISLPPVVTTERRYLSAAEVERLVSAIDPPYEAMVLVASYLGLRWHETAGLRRRYLELAPGRPASLRVVSTIERSGGRCRVVDLGKTKAARRTLAMPEFLRVVLAAHLSAWPNDEWVFGAPEGGFLRYDNFRMRVWAPAVEKANLQPLTFHCLRHTAAAFMIDDGADPLQLKRRMGHQDIRPSLDTYGHLFAQREDALVDALDRRRRAAVASLRSGDIVVTPATRRVARPMRERASEQRL